MSHIKYLGKDSENSSVGSSFTFLTNHAHVLVCLNQDPEMLMREMAVRIGVTERAIQRIIRDLVEAGILLATKDGRRNVYEIDLAAPLRHPLESHRTVGELLASVGD